MVPRRAYLCILARLSPLILIWFHTAAAQYHLDSWTTDNGLPQNSIRSIIQTRDGYLWMTTFDGLVRFNGVQFKVFDKSNTRGLSTTRFTALYEDKEGTLWVGTGDGGLTRYRDGIFTSYTAVDGVPAGQVTSFSHDLNGELLIVFGNDWFYMREGKFIRAAPEYGAKNLTHYRAPSGAQWTIGINGAKQIKDGSTIQYPLTLSDPGGVSPFEDSKGNLWLGGDKSGLYRLRDGQITRYSKTDGAPTPELSRPYCEDDEGGIWFGGDPLARFKDGRFTVYGKDSVLGGIYCIFKDREGTIWIGTSRGLYRLTKQFITGYSTANGLLHHEVYPILQAHNGDIWVGSILGLSRFRDGVFHNILLPNGSNVVQALGEDKNDSLGSALMAGYCV